MDIVKGRLDRRLLGLTQVKGHPAPESGFGLGGLRKLILTWEVHYFDKDFLFYFSQSVLRGGGGESSGLFSIWQLFDNLHYYYGFFCKRDINIKSLLTH